MQIHLNNSLVDSVKLSSSQCTVSQLDINPRKHVFFPLIELIHTHIFNLIIRRMCLQYKSFVPLDLKLRRTTSVRAARPSSMSPYLI